ncbi:hypothetical protein GQ42DRAFT_155821 [Ramicandelaber brevisporus]|nr:hypothetical protein GQ42DRAFT_155821 [Ramicandelaber brevisporus]
MAEWYLVLQQELQYTHNASSHLLAQHSLQYSLQQYRSCYSSVMRCDAVRCDETSYQVDTSSMVQGQPRRFTRQREASRQQCYSSGRQESHWIENETLPATEAHYGINTAINSLVNNKSRTHSKSKQFKYASCRINKALKSAISG